MESPNLLDMFNRLPKELQQYIYEYDTTWHKEFKKCLEFLNCMDYLHFLYEEIEEPFIISKLLLDMAKLPPL